MGHLLHCPPGAADQRLDGRRGVDVDIHPIAAGLRSIARDIALDDAGAAHMACALIDAPQRTRRVQAPTQRRLGLDFDIGPRLADRKPKEMPSVAAGHFSIEEAIM